MRRVIVRLTTLHLEDIMFVLPTARRTLATSLLTFVGLATPMTALAERVLQPRRSVDGPVAEGGGSRATQPFRPRSAT